VRKGVRAILAERFPFLEIVEAENLRQTQLLLEKSVFDLIILDLNLQDETAESLIIQLRLQFNSLPIIIFSMFPRDIMEEL
jgi:DNA-binding NarL/FixJ family response regulator